MKTCILLLCGLALGASCTGERDADPAPLSSTGLDEIEMNALMERHYTSAIYAHDSLIRGDLRTMRERMAELSEATLPDAAPSEWRPIHQRLRRAASRGRTVEELAAGAAALAEVAETCGHCHSVVAASPEYGMPPPPTDKEKVTAGMSRHQWETERLWEGITGPRDDAWVRGARGIAASKIFDDLGTGDLPARLEELEAELRALGKEAVTATGLPQRTKLYGRLLVGCATCHRAAGKLFPPPGRRSATPR